MPSRETFIISPVFQHQGDADCEGRNFSCAIRAIGREGRSFRRAGKSYAIGKGTTLVVP